MKLGEKLRNLRKRSGLSQDGLAAALEVSQNLVSAWERGASLPRIPELAALARVLRTTADYLVVDEDQRDMDRLDEEWRVRDVIEQIGWTEAYRRLVDAPRGSTAHTDVRRYDQPQRSKDVG